MTNLEIVRRRLHQQLLTHPVFKTPGEVVNWLGAVQAQDYLGSLWAIGLRLPGTNEAAIEQAIAARAIVRTWPMRGTIHYVAPADVRWMLELMTPRILARNTVRLYKTFCIDKATLTRSRELIINALQGGKALARNAVYDMLEAGGITASRQRGVHILWWLAQEGLICFGPREGKQPTFVLLEEWLPNAKRLPREESLGEVARRYFISHGPATVQDFCWWSGLSMGEANTALALAKSELVQEVIDGQTYWLSPSIPKTLKDSSSNAFLLPAYDEYTVAYKDRQAILDPLYAKQAGNGIFNQTMVINGQVAGTWKRTLKKDEVVVTVQPFTPLSDSEHQAFVEAASCYGKFLILPVSLS